MLSSRRRKPTMRQVEVFRNVLAAGSMKRAAEAMSISQPAVSKIIGSLEEDLQLRLFVRKKGGLLPSEAALTLYDRTERVFGGLEEIAEFAEQIRERRAGNLRVAAMSAMAISFLPRLVGQFVLKRAGVFVALDSHGSAEVIRHVRARRYDLGLAMPPVDFEGVHVRKTFVVRCVCILPKLHPLANRRLVTPELLHDEPFVSLAEGSLTRMRIDEVFASRNVARTMRIAARAPETVAQFVRGGRGVAVVDPFTAAHHKSCGGIVRPFLPIVPSTTCLIAPRGAELTELQADFIDLLESMVDPFLLREPV